MVVVPEPAVKGGCPLPARAVDRAIGPTGEQRADESLRLAVGLGPIGAGAAVPDPEPAAGEGVQRRDLGRAVVAQEPLDPDPAALVEGERALEEADRGRRLLVRQHLGVGEPAVVVDADVHLLVAELAPALALAVAARRIENYT